MNVLMTILSLLLVLSVLTMARVDSFVTQSLLRHSVESSLQAYETAWRHSSAKASYERQRAEKADSEDEDSDQDAEESSSRQRLNSMLDIRVMLDSGESENGRLLQDLLKRLIQGLYGERRFYREFMTRQRDKGRTEDQVLRQLIESMLSRHGDSKLRYKWELAELRLDDRELQNFFAKMLNGQPAVGNNPGHPSLLEYLTTQGRTEKVSVYLAGRPLLMALFGDGASVDDIMAVRMDIYRALVNGNTDQEEGSQRLQAITPDSEFNALLDFGVSKTRPKK